MRVQAAPSNVRELLAADEARDVATCGRSLGQAGEGSRFESQHAHEPTPTPYFVLEELFSHVELDARSHLLDVGCATGRVLAYFADAELPGRATGVELDPELAADAASWVEAGASAARFANLSVINASALGIPLADYTHFYLFNPFDTVILLKFLAKLETEAEQPVTLIHMSDNGETYFYVGRPGWSLLRQGEFQKHPAPNGRMFAFYDHPQHYSIWRFAPFGEGTNDELA